jgi:hypothetical protein
LLLVEPGKLSDAAVPVVDPCGLTVLAGFSGALFVVVARGEQKRIVIGVEAVEESTGHIAVERCAVGGPWMSCV